MEKALVVLSGGQDSATCLAWAKDKKDKGLFSDIYTITFDYKQRHARELICAEKLSIFADAKEHKVLPTDSLGSLGHSSLLNDAPINDPHPLNPNLPSSFVPGRNLVFLTLAAAYAYQVQATTILTGVCQTDFSGYPDCRLQTIKAIELAINLGITEYQRPITILTPLMYKTKAETVLLMRDLGYLHWYAHTHTCYEGLFPPCMSCPACKLRAKGFEEAGIPDPILG